MKWLAVMAAVLIASAAQADPIVRGAGAAAASTGSLINIDAGPAQANDLMLMFCQTKNQVVETPEGWAEVPVSPSVKSSVPANRLTAFWRIAQCDLAGTCDVDGQCEACKVFDPGPSHVLCAILSIEAFSFDATSPFDTGTNNQQTTTTSVSISGASATGSGSLVIAATGGGDNSVTCGADICTGELSGWTNANLSSITEYIDVSTIVGEDGTIGVAAGIRASSGAWGATTVTGPSTTWVSMSFNINPAPGASTPTSTATPTGTITPTVTHTRTVTDTPTITQTPTASNTPTVTSTPTRTFTVTNTPTVTQTPTPTRTLARCIEQASSGTNALKAGCDMQDTDDGSLVAVRRTPGSGKAFYSFVSDRAFSEWYTAAGARLGSSPYPYKLRPDATLTSSIDGRFIDFGRNASDVPTYTAGDVDGWGGVTKSVNATVTARLNFTGALPQRDGLAISPRRSYLTRCGPVTLDTGGVFCAFGAQVTTATIEAGQSMAAEGCQVASTAVTTFYDDDTRGEVPAGCVLFVSLAVDGAIIGQLCTVNGDGAPPANGAVRCDNSATGALTWDAGELRGLSFASLGGGCDGSTDVYVEVEVACGGAASD